MTQDGGFPPPGQAFPPPGAATPSLAWPPAGSVGAPAPVGPAAAPGHPGMAGPGYPAGPSAAYGLPMLHKPGIVALRPLGLGDLLDGAVKAIRRNPGATIGLSALVTAACLIPSAALSALLTTLAFDSDQSPYAGGVGTMPASLVQVLFTELATVLLSGMLVHVIGEAVLGRHTTLGRTWSSTRGRLLPVLGAALLVGLVVLVPLLVLVGGGVAIALTGPPAVGVPLAVVGGLACLALGVWLSVRTCMAAPAIVLEGLGVRAALRRSLALTRGAFWRTFGILLLASVMASVAASMLAVPFSVVGAVAALGFGGDGLAPLLTMVFVSHLGQLLSGALTTPFVAGVTGLLYIDRRIRLEGLDVTLIRAAQADATSRQG